MGLLLGGLIKSIELRDYFLIRVSETFLRLLELFFLVFLSLFTSGAI